MTRPVVLTLFLTHDCNLRCSYCYVHDKRSTTMPLEIGQAAVDLAVSLARRRVQVSFFGGEPLIEWDLILELHRYALERIVERGLEPVFALTTNGLLLTDERLERLKQNDVRVGISIDGCRSAQDATRLGPNGSSSFDRTAARLKRALEVIPDVQTISVIDPANVSFLTESVRELMSLGCRRITLNTNWGADWSDEKIRETWAERYEEIGDIYVESFRKGEPIRISFIEDKIITRLKEGYAPCDMCDFGHLDFAVSTTGNIYPCERQVGADGEKDEPMVIGHVSTGFDLKRQRNILRAVRERPAECQTCALRARCANWCPCANKAQTGDIGRPGGLLCYHEKLSTGVADRAAATLYQERNPHFMSRFYG